MDIILSLGHKFVTSLGPFFLLLGLLVFVHELGHYLVAVLCGVRVETFSLGFGKKIFSFKRGYTTYCISIIPLGGYVKMFGDDPNNPPPPEDRKQSFLHQPVWPRIAIVLAGPIMNLFFAILLFAHIGYWGEPVPGTKIGDIAADSAAYKAGFRSGDQIISINNFAVATWRQARELIEAAPGQPLNINVVHEDGAEATITSTPELKENPNIFSTSREVGTLVGLSLESRSAIVSVADKTLAQGIENLDFITEINGNKVEFWRQLEKLLGDALKSSKPFSVKVESSLSAEAKPATRSLTIDPKLTSSKGSALSRLGLESTELTVSSVKRGSPAQKNGLLPGDTILAVGAATVQRWDDLLSVVKSYSESTGPLEFKYRRNGTVQVSKIAPEVTEIPNMRGGFEKRFAIGISPALYTNPASTVEWRAGGFGASIIHGVHTSIEWSKLIGVSFARLIGGEVSAKNIGGVISIGRVANQSYDMGWSAFLKMMAILSINLFLLNLLPVPVLDGGHLVFFTIEAIKGSPLSMKKMEFAQQVGLVLLLCLMAFALFNDISNLISAW